MVRFTQPMKEATAWSKASIIKTKIKRNQYAYEFAAKDTIALLLILFSPDITTYRYHVPALTSDAPQ
jgi:hypothetical protein